MSRERFIRYIIPIIPILLYAFDVGLLFFFTGWLYKVANIVLPAVLIQIINAILALVLCWLNLAIVFLTPHAKRDRRGVFEPIFDALENIARGNFQVRLEHSARANPIIGGLTDSVNQMASGLSKLEAMRQEFISNVSHEIQSPLTSIRGFAQALHSEDLSAADREHYINIIEMESIRLSRLTDNLLKLASLETRQVPFYPKLYRLDQQIRGIILTCEPQWMQKAIDMDASLDEISISADEDLLSQVWLNLLHNSIKFTPLHGKIHVILVRQGDSIACTIADTGIGISAEDQEHIFERFYTADKSHKRSNEGSGLGLSIVQEIVTMHHGSVQVEGELGIGATFTVLLPLACDQPGKPIHL
jgi:two-component system, OmpR family, phosphate regulon sensor histidine kinase PhoR